MTEGGKTHRGSGGEGWLAIHRRDGQALLGYYKEDWEGEGALDGRMCTKTDHGPKC